MSNEPSMEDILSSIKRIIAEDTDAAMSAPRDRHSAAKASAEPHDKGDPRFNDESEVLELTEAHKADGPAETGTDAPAALDHEALDSEVLDSDAPAKPPLVSDATLNASRSAIATLSALVVKPESAGSDTLEGLVRELLKPMLADWLDQHLPEVVERLVAQEISRITTRV